MEAQEAEGKRNKHTKILPREKERKILYVRFQLQSITGNLQPFPILISVLRKKYDVIEKLFRDYPEPSLHTTTRY